ncbi:hypothetical protein Tco_1193362, partial [Tanacetum coccineum]
MGELTFLLGLQVMQRDDGIFISQDKYVADILKKFDFSSMKTASTPIETNKALLKDEEVEDVDVHLYRSMIGSLMYLIASRPDIMFAVYACARFQVTPKVSHLHAMKRIFRYLKGQPKLGIWYPRDSPFDLEGFSDSSYARASLDRKSTTGDSRLIWFGDRISDELGVKTDSCKVNAVRQDLVLLGEMVISESSVRTDLHFNDEDVKGEGSGQPSKPQPSSSTAPPSLEEQVTTVASQPQKTHTPRRAKIGRDTEIPQFSGPPKKVGDEAVYTGEDDRVVRAVTTATSLEAEQESDAQTRFETASKQSCDPPLSEVNISGSGEDNMEHQDDLTDFVPPTPHDSPLSGVHTPRSDKGRPNINGLMANCIKLSNRVLALETSKTAQDLVIKKLKKKVKRLEKKQRARTLGMKLFKIGTSRRKSLDKENVSKQGRNLKTRLMFEEGDFDDDFDDIDDMVNEEMENVKRDTVNAGSAVNTATTRVSTASASVTTVGVSISTAEPRTPLTTTTTAFENEDLTIAQTLVKMRSEKAKEKGVAFRDVEEFARSTKILPTIDPKDKGKGIMQEPEKPPKNLRKDQIQMDEELAMRMDADALLAARLQEEEREQFSIDEQARFLVETIAERKRFFSTQRAEQIRNKPPTKTQLRNKMITFLKNMGRFTYNQLKNKSLEEIQKLYEREQKWINDFVPIDSEMVKDSGKKDDDSQKQAESSKKRPRAEHDEESVKKQKLEDDVEKEELRACLDIVPGDDIAINVESVTPRKFP